MNGCAQLTDNKRFVLSQRHGMIIQYR